MEFATVTARRDLETKPTGRIKADLTRCVLEALVRQVNSIAIPASYTIGRATGTGLRPHILRGEQLATWYDAPTETGIEEAVRAIWDRTNSLAIDFYFTPQAFTIAEERVEPIGQHVQRLLTLVPSPDKPTDEDIDTEIGFIVPDPA